MSGIEHLRNQIDQIDEKIVALLEERLRLAKEIGHAKRAMDKQVADVAREKQVLSHLCQSSHNAILNEYWEQIYPPIMEAAKVMQTFALPFPFERVGIIGCGLLGGSLLKACMSMEGRVQTAILHYNDDDSAQAAHVADRVFSTLDELTAFAQLLILCVPISQVIPIASEIAKTAQQPLVVIDVASVKSSIAKQFEEMTNAHVDFIATHPMAGSEKHGFVHGKATLFYQAAWVITPHMKNRHIAQIEQAIRCLGAKPILIEPQEHDRCAALVSHAPSLLARAFLEFAHDAGEQPLSMAGPGFRSFTRLAHQNPQLRNEIAQANAHYIQEILARWFAWEQKTLGENS